MTDDKAPAVEPLDVDNYPTWSVRMECLLTYKGLWSTVIGEDSTTRTKEKDGQARALISPNCCNQPIAF